MFGKFSEQLQKSAQPVNSLVSLNAKTLESLSQHQTEWFTGLLSDSVKYVENVSHQTEVKGVLAANTAYAEAMRERFASVSKETYSTLSDMREQMTQVMKLSFESTASEVESAVNQAVEKSVKTAEKVVELAAEATPKTEVKAEPKAEEKPVEAAPVDEAPKAEAKAPAKKPATRTRRTTAKKPASAAPSDEK